MNKNTSIGALLAIAVLVLAVLIGSFGLQTPAEAAPMAAPTPAGVARAAGSPTQGTLWNSKVITSDTRGNCINSANYEKADVFYHIDQGTVNTVTLSLQHTNRTPGQPGTLYAAGNTIVASNGVDATALQQAPVYGAWTCIYADVTNTNTLTLTVDILLK